MALDETRTFEFWLGRAGSGKTFACLEAIASRMRENSRGKPLFLLVPEQASAQMEYALAARMGLTGYTRARVITFRYLKHEIFEAVGGKPANVVDDESRVILLRQIARRRSEDLEVMGACATLPGLAESVSQSLLEFQRYGWTPEMLAGKIESLGGDGRDTTLLHAKLSDLLLLWSAYENELGDRDLIDDSQLIELAAEKLADWEELDGLELWIDGFASFTMQERLLLEGLLARARLAALSLCLDPKDARFRQRVLRPKEWFAPRINARTGPERLFENVEQTYFGWRSRLEELAWKTRDIEFPRENLPQRFTESGPLAHLEAKSLTRLHPVRYEGEAADAVELIEAEDRRGEIEAIARRISEAVRSEADLNWRDIAVLARDTEPYAPLVREIFPRYGIPFFLDELRRVSGHPLARLIVSVLRIARYGWRTDYVLDALKSGLAPLGESPLVSRLQHFAREERLHERHWLGALGETGKAKRDVWAGEGDLSDAWKQAGGPMLDLSEKLRSGVEPARALWEFLQGTEVAQRLEAWIDKARLAGDEETVMTHQQAWSQALAMLDRVHTLGLSEANGSDRVEELLEIFETGLTTLRVGLTPPTLDQVLVGAIDRTRTPPVRVGFVLGMNDTEFPRVYEEEPVLSDRDRRELTDPKHPLGPDSRAKYSQERYLCYIALTRASERLCVLRPAASGGDEAAGPSVFFRALDETFSDVEVKKFRRALDLSANDGLATTPSMWAGALTQLYHRATQKAAPENLWTALERGHPLRRAELVDLESRSSRTVARVLGALEPTPAARLDAELAREFWTSDCHLGVTSVETFAACPFQFFASRMLRLERPREPLPGPMELGSLRHGILDRLYHELKDAEGWLDWGRIDLQAARHRIEGLGWIVAREEMEKDFGEDGLTRAMIEGVIEEMKHFVSGLRTMGERYGLSQIGAEYQIGERAGRSFGVATDSGIRFELKGSVDRVDCVRGDGRGRLVLYDYKSSARNLDPGRWQVGAELQLPVYAVAVEAIEAAAGNDARVEGLFYWPLSIGLSAAEGEDESWADPGSPAWFKKHAPEGVGAEAITGALDTSVGGGDSALAFKFKLNKPKKDAPPALAKNMGLWLEGAYFRKFVEASGRKLEALCNEIGSGKVDVAPLRKGSSCTCDYCDYAAMCRIGFEETPEYRETPPLTKKALPEYLDELEE